MATLNDEAPLDLIEVLRAFFFASDRGIRLPSGSTLTLGDGTDVESGNQTPNDAAFVVTSSDADLTNEKVLTAGTGIQITVAAGSVTISNTAAVIPSGLIAIWSGSTGSIPSGWVLCNGANGTPNLQDKFVIGAGSTYAVNDTGGNSTINLQHSHGPGTLGTDSDNHSHGVGTLTTASDNHSHGVGTLTTASDNHSHGPGTLSTDNTATFSDIADTGDGLWLANYNHSHNVDAGSTASDSHSHTVSGSTASDSHSHTVSGSTASDSHSHTVTTGSTDNALSTAQDIMNPYYALAFIMKT